MLAQIKADKITARLQSDAHKVIYKAGGGFDSVAMSRLQREQMLSCYRVETQIERRLLR